MGPSNEESVELAKQGQGGNGRKPRQICHVIDANNLIPVRIFKNK